MKVDRCPMCEHENDIQAYHDQRLNEPRKAEIQSHLNSCPVCQETLADYQKIQRVVRGASMPPITPFALKAVHRAFLKAQDRSVRVLAEWLSVAAAAILLFMLLNPISTSSPQPNAGSPQAWELNSVMAASPMENQSERQLTFAQWVTSDLTQKNEGLDIKEP